VEDFEMQLIIRRWTSLYRMRFSLKMVLLTSFKNRCKAYQICFAGVYSLTTVIPTGLNLQMSIDTVHVERSTVHPQ